MTLSLSSTLPPVGLDVSKATLDVRYSTQAGKGKRFCLHTPNTLEGFEQSQAWFSTLGASQVHVCLEASGTYSDAVALFLLDHGHVVSVVNPARLCAFRKSEGQQSKTDRADALLLAQFCEQKRPRSWQPTPAAQQQLQLLVQRLDDLEGMRQAERNRLENSRLSEGLRSSIREMISQIETHMQQLGQQMHVFVQEHQEVQRSCDLLDSIAGLAQLSAMRMVSVFGVSPLLPTARACVAFVGLNPVLKESGTRVHGHPHISKWGNAQVRKWLYLCALSVMRSDADARTLGERVARARPQQHGGGDRDHAQVGASHLRGLEKPAAL